MMCARVNFLRWSLLGCLFAAIVPAVTRGETVTVTIVNPSFEALDAVDVGTIAASRWSTDGLATFDPTNAQFTGTVGNDVQGELPNGGQIANLDLARVLSQSLGVQAVPGATYSLNFFQGQRRDGAPGSYRVELLEGSNAIINQVITTTTPGFQAAPLLSGKATGNGQLTLRFTNTAGQSFLDSPTLTASLGDIRVINVPNGNFNAPDVGDVATGTPASWTATGLAIGNGVFDPGSAQFPATQGNNEQGGLPGADGQVGNIESTDGSLSQNLGVIVTPSDEIHLNVAIGNRADGADPNYSLQLLLNGTPFATLTNPVSPLNGEFAVAELIGTPTGTGELGIRFLSHGGQTFLDNVVVFAVHTPEPGSLVAFMLCALAGAVILVGCRARHGHRVG